MVRYLAWNIWLIGYEGSLNGSAIFWYVNISIAVGWCRADRSPQAVSMKLVPVNVQQAYLYAINKLGAMGEENRDGKLLHRYPYVPQQFYFFDLDPRLKPARAPLASGPFALGKIPWPACPFAKLMSPLKEHS